MSSVENKQIVETPTQARAGATGHNVRYVLAFGTLGAIVVLIVIATLTLG